MLFREQHQRLPSVSEPRRRPREQRERGSSLSQGPRLRLKSRIMRRRRGRQWSKGQSYRLILRRGKEDGPGPKQGRSHIFPGLLTRLGRRPSSSRGKGKVWEKSNAIQREEATAKIRVKRRMKEKR